MPRPLEALNPSTIDAVVFDIGGVFIYPDPALVKAAQADLGIPVDESGEMYRRAHHAGVLALASEGETREAFEGFWHPYDNAYLAEVGADVGNASTFAGTVRASWTWPYQPNIDAFHRLASTDLDLAIVSNNDGSAEQSMIECGVCQVGPGPLPEVAIVVDSAVVGIAKPDPAIMEPALEALGVERGRALYVGDTIHADVAAALSAGMQVVQLDPFGHHSQFDHPRLPDVATLAELLT